MASAAFSPSSGYQRATPRQRALAAAIALAIEVLIALALIFAAPRQLVRERLENALKTFSVTPAPERPASQPASPKPTVAKQQTRSASAPPAAAAVPPPPVPVKAPAPTVETKLIPMDFGKSDVSKLPQAGAGDSAGAGDDVGKQASTYGPGAGPGGERLYSVAWYREPTHAELAGYLPNGAPPGSWAEIACRMIDHYHVENCRSLSESPVGSGLARSMRQAAWQFLVRPPRLGDKVLLGSWVRIRIDFSEKPGDDK